VLLLAMERYAAIIDGTSAREGVGFSRGPDVTASTARGAASSLEDLTTLTISVSGGGDAVLNATKFMDMDESYTLSVPSTGPAVLSAPSTLGALRGLETFAQLVDFTAVPAAQIAATPVHITDEPRFPWRGLRLDSSRHFLPLRTIRSALDAMAAAKLNVLLWHIVDANSFPLQLDGFEELATKGSFCPQCVYTSDDVRDVVEYARQRGIRVQAEVDVPGHSGWQYGRPDLVACPTYEAFGGCARALDMTQDAVYDFLKRFFLEVAEIFPEPVINMCGDELRFECLDSNPAIKAFAAKNNMTYFDLEQHFWTRMNEPGGVIEALSNKGKIIAVAEGSSAAQGSVKLGKFPRGTIAEIWGGTTLMEGVYGVLTNNTRVNAILGGPYYLDVQAPGEPSGHHYGWMDTWISLYNAEPFADPRLTLALQKRVLGGMAEQWSEQVDASSIESRMWPRALAVAERLWSKRNQTWIENKTVARLEKASCQALERRGIRGGPVASGFCPWSLHWDS
jgi:hexosaminidase